MTDTSPRRMSLLVRAVGIGVRAAPLTVAALAGLTVVAAVLPVAAAWCTKVLFDRIADGTASWPALAGAVTGLLLVGLASGVYPHVAEYLRAGAPSQLVLMVLNVARTAVTLVGFLGSLLVISPAMAWIVLLGAVPTLVFHGRMLRERLGVNRLNRRMDRRTVLVQGALAGFAAVVAGLGLLWAVKAAIDGRLGVGDIVVFLAAVAAVAAVQASLGDVAFGVAAGRQHLLVFGHYLTVVDAGPDLPDGDPDAVLPPSRTGIEFRDVWFRYSDDHPGALRAVSLTIPCGQSMALVGVNGAGRSTMAKLMCRFYAGSQRNWRPSRPATTRCSPASSPATGGWRRARPPALRRVVAAGGVGAGADPPGPRRHRPRRAEFGA